MSEYVGDKWETSGSRGLERTHKTANYKIQNQSTVPIYLKRAWLWFAQDRRNKLMLY